MKFQDAALLVSNVPEPHIPASRGRVLYDNLRKQRPENVLELGTARGGSAIFMAAALEANGRGHLTSVDSSRWQWRNPTPREVLDNSGLGHLVTLDKNYSTYAWFLKGELEKSLDDNGLVRPKYDFIFLDGAKNWSTDGVTVLVAEQLLRPGGWLLLDDLGWTYDKYVSTPMHYEIEIAKLSESERAEPHLRAVFDLLLRTNPAFDEFLIQDDWWGWAHKSADAGQAAGRGAAPRARVRVHSTKGRAGGATAVLRRSRTIASRAVTRSRGGSSLRPAERGGQR